MKRPTKPVSAWLTQEDMNNVSTGAPGPITRELLSKAGYAEEIVAACPAELEELVEEQHDSPEWLTPDDAPEELLHLALALPKVRRQRRIELETARPIVTEAARLRAKQVAGGGRNSTATRDRKIAALAARMRKRAFPEKVRVKDVRSELTTNALVRGNVLGKDTRVVDVPSSKVIGNAIRRSTSKTKKP